MEITEDALAELVANFPGTVNRIRAGANAYPKVRGLPQVEYDPFGNGFIRWRGTPVLLDTALGRDAVQLEGV